MLEKTAQQWRGKLNKAYQDYHDGARGEWVSVLKAAVDSINKSKDFEELHQLFGFGDAFSYATYRELVINYIKGKDKEADSDSVDIIIAHASLNNNISSRDIHLHENVRNYIDYNINNSPSLHNNISPGSKMEDIQPVFIRTRSHSLESLGSNLSI